MERNHYLVLGVLIQLLIFIVGAEVLTETQTSAPPTQENESGKVKVGRNESSVSVLVKNNTTRSKLWSPYSTVVSIEFGPPNYEEHPSSQQTPNQKIPVNQTQYQSPGPLISNIRHHKSRKSFFRVKPAVPVPKITEAAAAAAAAATSSPTTEETKKVGIEENHDWQGDGPPIPTDKNHPTGDFTTTLTNVTGLRSRSSSSIYGEAKLSPSPGKKVSGGRRKMGNFTKIDQMKTFLFQNKSSSTPLKTMPSNTSTHFQTPTTPPLGQSSELGMRRPGKFNNSQGYSRARDRNGLGQRMSGDGGNERRRKSSIKKPTKSMAGNMSLSQNPISQLKYSSHDYQSQNFEDYGYGEGGNGPDPSESPILVPGIFPTFHDNGENVEEDESVYDDPNPSGSGNPESSDPDIPPTSEMEDNKEMDILTNFLRIIEEEKTSENCTAGVNLTLGQGVVDRYAQDRFRLEAEVAVNRANMLTRLWKYAPRVMESEYLLHASLLSIIEFADNIFAAGNCYDGLEYKSYKLFCPFAHRLPEGNAILVKDLALEYNYLTNASEFFLTARRSAERVISNSSQFSRGQHVYPYNDTHTGEISGEEILNVTYEDGKWSMPYFDCGGGNIWMMTYTVPFFGFRNETYYFKGTSGIDIDLRRVDIDQCPSRENSTELNIFQASNKCKNATTKCDHIKGMGFRRGSYRCVCREGFYFPNISSPIKYFNGSLLEEEYENKFLRKSSRYDEKGAFECLPCASGCDNCEDDRPCVVTLNWLMRTAILILQSAIILMLPLVGLFTWKYSEVKVVRAASPLLLRFIVLGAFFIYCTTLVMYPSPSVITCTLQVWLREIGFSLAYGALMLKTWRISVIFRVRSAKAVKITDLDLMKRLGIIVGMFTVLLAIRTIVAPPVSIVSLTSDELKAWLCKSDWWDHSFTIMELSFLVWGIRLCIVVRKAPSEFNESKFISLAIYNEFLLSLFLNISMLFLQSPANPDLLYIIFFCHVQLTMTLLLCLIFGSKAYMVFRGNGKGGGSDELRPPTAKFINKGRPGQASGGQNSTSAMNCRFNASISIGGHEKTPSLKFPEDVQDEFRRLYSQLEELKEKNMRLGNRHLVAKITAMQEAADMLSGNSITLDPSAQTPKHEEMVVTGRSCLPKEIGPSSPNAFLAIVSSQNGSSTSHPKGKSTGILSDISEDENPSSSSTTPGVGAETKRLGTCRSPDCGALVLMKGSIPPSNLSTSDSPKAKAPCTLPLNLGTPSSPGESVLATSASENEVQVGDDELLDRYKDIEEEVACSENEARMSRRENRDCDNEGSGLHSISSNSETNAKPNDSRATSTSSKLSIPASGLPREKEIEEALGAQNETQKLGQINSLEPQDPGNDGKSQGSANLPAPTGATGETPPSKMILDLNDKSRFTEEITV